MKNLLFCTGLFFAGLGTIAAQTEPSVTHGRAIGYTTVITGTTRTTKIKCDDFFQEETCYTTSTEKPNNGIQKFKLAIYATKTMGEDYFLEGNLLDFYQEKAEDGKSIESTFTSEDIE